MAWCDVVEPRTLRECRIALGQSQAAFAAMLGASPESYRTWDAGRRATPLKILARAKALATHRDDHALLPLPVLALLIGVHVKTLRSATRDGRLLVTYDTRTTFRRLRARATPAAARAFRRSYYAEAIAAWTPRRSGRRGGQRRYSDLAIETAMTLRLLYHLPLRQAEGFLHALFRMMRLDLSVPDYTTLSRRSQHLTRRLRPMPPGEGLHLVLDSTGLSIVGAGEWAAAKHGGRGRRGWRKLHLGVDQSGVILVHTLTEATGDDATTALDLLNAVDGPLVRVTADAAYDTVAVYETATARGATVIIPPAKTANISGHGPRSPARDRTVTLVKQLGRRRWKKVSGYHRQGRVENTFFRYKVPLRDRCSFGRFPWLISQALSVTYMAGERRLYLERNCRLPESPAHSRRRNREGPASSKGLNSQRGFGPAVEPRRKSRPRSTSLHGSSPCKCQRLSTLRWDRLPPSRPSTKSGARAGGRRLSDRRLHRWLAGTSASAPSSHGAADLLGLNRAHICVRNPLQVHHRRWPSRPESSWAGE